MKLQLDNKTLNAYINEALKQELNENNMDELFGSRDRKKNIRAITGQGWGNQNRDTKNFWGAANSDISNTDAESEAPQTLVGIVTKLEKQLMDLEKVIGIAPQAENLGASITQTRNNGGVKTKASLLAAINALGRIADRLSVVEQQTGLNKIMESVDEKVFNVGYSTPKPTWINGALGGIKRTLGATTASTAVGKALLGAGKLAGGTVGAGVAVVAGIAAACFAIAQTAATIASKGRSRNIVRTFNCASVLAKRMGNVAEALKGKLEAQQGTQMQQNPEIQQETGQVNELNVGKAKKSFGTIEQGMQQLSALMKQIHAKINGQGQEQAGIQMPQSLNTPQEIKQFQEWANANGYVDQNGQQLAADGKFGQRTSYVYDQVAQKLGQLQESRGQINEAGGIENALKTLERKVGTTGTGGAAYADISALSGGQGQGSSRLQNAQNAKNIMRTYPPVLNQYLQILKSAGANVNNLLPLRDDQRPHRNYSVKELQMIDRRIQELIQVAQTFEPQQGQENVKLPPKPIRRSNPNPRQQPEPEVPQTPDLGDVQIDEPEMEVPVDDFSNLDSSVPEVQKMGYPNPINPNEPQGEQDFVDNVIDTLRKMGMDNNASIKFKKMSMSQAYQNAMVAIDRMVEDGTIDNATARSEKQKLRSYYQQFKRGGRDAMFGDNWKDTFSPQQQQQTISEQAFKKLVKQIITEMLNK